MKFFAAIVAGAAAVSAMTPTVNKRDAASISAAISKISADAASLSSAVNSFSGAADVTGLQTATQKLIDDIKAGAANAGTTPLSSGDAAGLAGPIQDLGSVTQQSINGVIAKKPAFDKLGVSGVVYDELTQIKAAAQSFSSAVIKLVPAGLQPLANQLSQPLIDSIQKGITAYQGSADSGSSSGSTSSAAATSAAATSAASSMAMGGSTKTSSAAAVATATATSNGTGYSTPAPTPVTAGGALNVANIAAVAVAAIAVAAF